MVVPDSWQLIYEGFEAEEEALREALCTLGNGCFATRGAAEETSAGEAHYPGTYIAGGYNRLESEVAGHRVVNEDLVNFPNWLGLSFRPADGEWLNLLAVEILHYRQSLDFRRGVLRREMRVRDHQGRESAISSERFVSMRVPWLAGIRWELTPLNWSGPLEIRTSLDGGVINSGVERYRALNSKHLKVLNTTCLDDGTLCLEAETSQSHIRVAQAARTQLYSPDGELNPARTPESQPESIGETLSLEAARETPLTAEKMVVFINSRMPAVSTPVEDARAIIARVGRFGDHLREHEQAWVHLWDRYDIDIDHGNPEMQQQLRLHTFHLLQTVSMHSISMDAGVPARGLHGEAYRGHIFWDSLFILPFFNYRIPQVSRALLMYRYRRLDAARWNARQQGFEGALFPWQSGSTGREESQRLHLNPRSGQWDPDYSHLQFHVNVAIAYNIWRYFQVTDDVDFMNVYGDEMFVEIARFWASISRYDQQRDRYDIRGVMGPDEYHEKYPGAETAGLDNNAYTNVMASWTLQRAIDLVGMRTPQRRIQLLERLGLATEELDRWRDISCKLTLHVDEDGIIEQFEGYSELEEFDWSGYREKYGDIQRLDRILKAEGDSPDRYKVSKQADLLMLFYLFGRDEIRALLSHLGHEMDEETIERHIRYYHDRTSHGSTLSHVVHASVLNRIDPESAWKQFRRVLKSDLFDIQGGTTSEGIHLGAMAGSVDIVFRHYAGTRLLDEGLELHPHLPEALPRLNFKLRYRGHVYLVRATRDRYTLTTDANRPRCVLVDGQEVRLAPGEPIEVAAKSCVIIPAWDR